MATFATWNPLDKHSGIALSGGNLTALSSGQWRGVRSTIGKSSGKWYWEYTLYGITTTVSGIGKSTASLGGGGGGDFLGNMPDGYGLVSSTSTPSYTFPPAWTAYGTGFSGTPILGLYLDMDAGTLGFTNNGVDMGVAFTGITGTYFAQISLQSGVSLLANFGATPFAYPVPSGFNAGLYNETANTSNFFNFFY